MTAADLERANLLPRPGTSLSAAAGVVYFLIFEQPLVDLTADFWQRYVEGEGQLLVLEKALNGNVVGMCVKVIGTGAPKTVQSALVGLNRLRFAVQGADPRTLPTYIGAALGTNEFNDGIVAVVERAAKRVADVLPDPKEIGMWVVVVLVLVALILIVPRLIGTKD